MFGTYRLFLAILVVCTHIGHVEVLAGLAVWGFFMLSGYLITGVLHTRYGFGREGLLAFAISRMFRLYPAYWCVALVTLAVTAWFRSVVDPQLVNTAFAPLEGLREWVSAAFVIPHTSLGIGRVEHALVPPIWAVDVEITLYLLSCFFVSRSSRSAKRAVILSALLFPLLWVVARMLIHVGDIDTAGQLLYSFIPAALLPYSIGAYLFYLTGERGGLTVRIRAPASIGIPVAVASIFFLALVVSRFSNTLSYVAALPVLAYLVVVLSGIQNSGFKSFDDFLGLMSYPMYLAHYLCAYVAVIGVHQFSQVSFLIASDAGPTFRYTILGFGVITCLALLFSAALAFGLERPIERVRRSMAMRLAEAIRSNRLFLVPGDVLIEIAVGLLLVLGFSQGIWQAAGFADGIPKALIELLSAALLGMAIRQRKRANLRFRGLIFLIPLGTAYVSGAVSGWLYDSSALEQFFFLRAVLSPLMVFLAVLNLPISPAGIRRLSVLTAAFVLIQVPFFAWKWYAVGVNEKFWIGSLSQTAGQLGLTFPMLVLAAILPWYLHTGRRALALLILVFAFLPVINEKRAAIVAIPAILLFSVGVYLATNRGRKLMNLNFNRWVLSRFAVLTLVCLTVWVGAIKLIPSLYCEQYQTCQRQTIQYIFDYLTRDYYSPMNRSRLSEDENTNIQLGRLELIRTSLVLMTEHGTMVTLFGFGAGAVNPSPRLGVNRLDIMYDKFGLRGSYPSALALLFEAGMVGVLSMLGFFTLLTIAVVKRIRGAVNEDHYLAGLGVLLMISVMFFDYFLYSIAGWSTYTIGLLFFIAAGFFLIRSCQEPRSDFSGGARE